MRKELLELIKKLEAEQGARVETTKSGWMVYPPDKSKPGVAIHGTPSDRRAWANMRSELRRSGFTI